MNVIFIGKVLSVVREVSKAILDDDGNDIMKRQTCKMDFYGTAFDYLKSKTFLKNMPWKK